MIGADTRGTQVLEGDGATGPPRTHTRCACERGLHVHSCQRTDIQVPGVMLDAIDITVVSVVCVVSLVAMAVLCWYVGANANDPILQSVSAITHGRCRERVPSHMVHLHDAQACAISPHHHHHSFPLAPPLVFAPALFLHLKTRRLTAHTHTHTVLSSAGLRWSPIQRCSHHSIQSLYSAGTCSQKQTRTAILKESHRLQTIDAKVHRGAPRRRRC